MGLPPFSETQFAERAVKVASVVWAWPTPFCLWEPSGSESYQHHLPSLIQPVVLPRKPPPSIPTWHGPRKKTQPQPFASGGVACAVRATWENPWGEGRGGRMRGGWGSPHPHQKSRAGCRHTLRPNYMILCSVPWPSSQSATLTTQSIPGLVNIRAITADPATTNGVDRSPSVKEGSLIAAKTTTTEQLLARWEWEGGSPQTKTP